MRVRALIDARSPLLDSIGLKVKGGAEVCVKIKYERLPLFCYVCGRLGHREKDCDENRDNVDAAVKFSDELRASPWKANRGGREDASMREKSGCSRKLFVTKKKTEQNRVEGEAVDRIVKELKGVSLSLGVTPLKGTGASSPTIFCSLEEEGSPSS